MFQFLGSIKVHSVCDVVTNSSDVVFVNTERLKNKLEEVFREHGYNPNISTEEVDRILEEAGLYEYKDILFRWSERLGHKVLLANIIERTTQTPTTYKDISNTSLGGDLVDVFSNFPVHVYASDSVEYPYNLYEIMKEEDINLWKEKFNEYKTYWQFAKRYFQHKYYPSLD